MNNNEQGQGGRNDKLVISTACEETGLGTAEMQQSRSVQFSSLFISQNSIHIYSSTITEKLHYITN